MNGVDKLYLNHELTILKKRSADSNTWTDRVKLLNVLEERDKKIIRLEQELEDQQLELWKLRMLYRRLKELANEGSSQDQLYKLYQLVKDPGAAFSNMDSPAETEQQYIRRLKKCFPALSSNDLRICSLLRQNLSTKEIACNLGIGADSANKARYRIRKKLNLKRREDLLQVLLEF